VTDTTDAEGVDQPILEQRMSAVGCRIDAGTGETEGGFDLIAIEADPLGRPIGERGSCAQSNLTFGAQRTPAGSITSP